MKECPKVCHDKPKCHGGCKRDSGCDCREKKRYRKKVKRSCDLPCKVKDQIKLLEVESRYCGDCYFGCVPKIYDPAKLVQKCNYVCCNTSCKDCKDCTSEKSCTKYSSSSSSSSSSVTYKCKVTHRHKDC